MVFHGGLWTQFSWGFNWPLNNCDIAFLYERVNIPFGMVGHGCSINLGTLLGIAYLGRRHVTDLVGERRRPVVSRAG
jgi:hypothetical protein